MRAVVCGANGAMGKLICGILGEEVAGKVSIDGENNVPKTFEELGEVAADVVIDFSHHTAVSDVLAYAKKIGAAAVIGTTGHTAEEKEMIFDKTVNSPFRDSGLLEYLREKNIRTIIVTGLQTDYCIDSTVKCGFEHGFQVIVPEYANSTFDNDFMSAENSYRYYNEFMWKNRYAKCVSVDEAVRMMKK